jgi:hypothetical protein
MYKPFQRKQVANQPLHQTPKSLALVNFLLGHSIMLLFSFLERRYDR